MVVADAVVSYIEPIQKLISRYLDDKAHLVQILEEGRDRAFDISQNTLEEVHQKMGLKVSLKEANKIPMKS